MSGPRDPVSRREEIEAAITAYNADQASLLLLPPDAARLLAVMFRENSVCRRPFEDLVAEGFDRWPLHKLLRGLVDAGFLSKGPRHQGRYGFTTYTLHLPPRRQP